MWNRRRTRHRRCSHNNNSLRSLSSWVCPKSGRFFFFLDSCIACECPRGAREGIPRRASPRTCFSEPRARASKDGRGSTCICGARDGLNRTEGPRTNRGLSRSFQSSNWPILRLTTTRHLLLPPHRPPQNGPFRGFVERRFTAVRAPAAHRPRPSGRPQSQNRGYGGFGPAPRAVRGAKQGCNASTSCWSSSSGPTHVTQRVERP